MHKGNSETWIQARAAINRGRGILPRHARGGRRANPPAGLTRALTIALGREFHGWTGSSIQHAVKIGAL